MTSSSEASPAAATIANRTHSLFLGQPDLQPIHETGFVELTDQPRVDKIFRLRRPRFGLCLFQGLEQNSYSLDRRIRRHLEMKRDSFVRVIEQFTIVGAEI